MKRTICILLCFFMLCAPFQGAQQEKYIVLTFDDGPSGRFTRRLLDGLQARNVYATFFLCGYRMAMYPELTERIWQEGHEIGLHGYSHQSMENMSKQELLSEIAQTAALLPPEYPAVFLRPPGGLCGNAVQAVAKEQSLAILHWSIDPMDWATDDTSAIEKAVLSRVHDGDVILMHDMSDSFVDAALKIVDTLLAQGYSFVTASQLAARRKALLTPGTIYAHF